MQEQERELQRQRQVELARKAAERREIRRLSKTFAITLEGSFVLDIPPKVPFLVIWFFWYQLSCIYSLTNGDAAGKLVWGLCTEGSAYHIISVLQNGKILVTCQLPLVSSTEEPCKCCHHEPVHQFLGSHKDPCSHQMWYRLGEWLP